MKGYHITNDVVIYNDMERGWVRGKYQPKWHKKVYDMWKNMWKRVYTELHWFGSLIHPSFQYLSKYVKWIEFQPRFEEFCKTCDTTMWSIDKDSKHLGNRYYYPEYMTLTTQSENTRERNIRNGHPMLKKEYASKSGRKRMKPVIGIPLGITDKTILVLSTRGVAKYGFHPGNVSECLTKKRKSHNGYKWLKVNYKHNRKYRIGGDKYVWNK